MLAAFGRAFAHHGPLPKELFHAERSLSRLTIQVLRGRGNWELNEGSQTTGLQAVLGFPGQPALSAGRSSRRRRSRQEYPHNIAKIQRTKQ
jgi:hypothetical protein